MPLVKVKVAVMTAAIVKFFMVCFSVFGNVFCYVAAHSTDI